ncbi:MAG: hypothetical protein M1816_005970 [Peltula sp. TS41687]|nr:MAG: hypothetical protein M1816_005970 [Peltula sp. TS41687]
MTRHVRRMQPEALNASTGPRGPLAWGQINFLHTTDTHGWLEGHLKEENYGADWGDFVGFTRQMRSLAKQYKVDLLLVDTGDLHDGNGLSDATTPNGNVSNAIFERLDYDILTIGNHELYVTEIAYETFNNFSKAYGDKYVTSNVEIRNPSTGQWEYIGSKYRYFKTPNGLHIMAFGVLFDFTGNSNVSRVTKAADLVKQQWFLDAINYEKPIDLFVVAGHNPVDPTAPSSTLDIVQQTIRKARPDVPIQLFGGHTHIRDFVVYDSSSTGLESGQYCETVGWVSISGIKTKSYNGNRLPPGVPHPTQPAIAVSNSTNSTQSMNGSYGAASSLRYFRRYLDWNTRTFAYHAPGSQDLAIGAQVSAEISDARRRLNLTALYGCAPRTWCQYCQPFEAPGNIFSLVETALSAVVVNESRADIPRLIITNTGHIRFSLVQGPFTYDDSFIVSPFLDAFQYLPNVPYSLASQVINILNNRRSTGTSKKRSLTTPDFQFTPLTLQDSCVDPPISHNHLSARSYAGGRIIRRQSTELTPGYTTKDDFGSDGDDTPHSFVQLYAQPAYVQANGSLPSPGSAPPQTVDLVFLDYVARDVLAALKSIGAANYTLADVEYYLDPSFTTNSYLPAYARREWQGNVPDCPVGEAVGE